MNPEGLVWLSIGGLVATCFAAIGVRVLRQFSRHDLEEVCRRHEDRRRFTEILKSHDRVALGIEVLVVLATSVLVVAGTCWIWDLAGRPTDLDGRYMLANALGIGLILVVIKVWIPWSVSRLSAVPFLYHTWRVWKVLSQVVMPITWGARMIDAILHRLAGREPELPNEESFEDEIRTIVTEGHREGLLEEDAREMIEGVIELGDADVAKIMTPRTDMHTVSVDLPWDELVADVIQLGHTRIPVFDKNRDDIVGVLYSKDLLPELAKPTPADRKPVREMMRRPLFVPETKAVDDLLEMFQHTRTHIALVLDEYGGVSGLVTIEDVLEEIVGEIVDEYDAEHIEEIQQLDKNTWESLGKAHVDDINQAIAADIPDNGDYDTIAGFVFSEFGRVPQEGESLLWQQPDSHHGTRGDATTHRAVADRARGRDAAGNRLSASGKGYRRRAAGRRLQRNELHSDDVLARVR